MTDTNTTTDIILEDLERIRARFAELADLDAELDAAIVRARDAGITQRTIAEIFGWTPGAVSQRERKARLG